MDSLLYVCFFACVLTVSAQESNCTEGYWGDSCQNYCGYCASQSTTGLYDRKCDPTDGSCIDTGCQGGWTGVRCDIPICEGDCNGGQCVAPGMCANCGDISKVAPGCTNIKLRGLLGSLVAIIVLTLSLATCGLGTIMYERRKASSVPL